MKKILFLMLVFGVAMAGPAHAGDMIGNIDANANSSDYLVKMPNMILRGAIHAVASPLDLLGETITKTKEGDPILGTVHGIVNGTYLLVDRASRGVLDVVGSVLPGFNGAPTDREIGVGLIN